MYSSIKQSNTYSIVVVVSFIIICTRGVVSCEVNVREKCLIFYVFYYKKESKENTTVDYHDCGR